MYFQQASIVNMHTRKEMDAPEKIILFFDNLVWEEGFQSAENCLSS